MKKRTAKRAGFTLLEVVISVAILGLMMTIGYGSLAQLIRSKQALEAQQDEDAIANAVLLRMIRELQLAIGGIGILPPPDQAGMRMSTRINLEGSPGKLNNGQPGDSITFLALEGGQYLPDGGTHSGIVQISYRVAPDPDQEQTSSSTYYLVRQETPLMRPPAKAYEKTMTFPITRNLVGLEFHYMDKETGEWSSAWGNAAHMGLPAVIRFSVKLRVGNGQVRTLTTAVPIKGL